MACPRAGPWRRRARGRPAPGGAEGKSAGGPLSQASSSVTTEQANGVVACVAYAEGRRLGDISIPDISEVLKKPGVFVWIGLHDPSPELLKEIQHEFGLHDLAVEDAQLAHQRPKLEQYGDSIFVVLRPAIVSADRRHVELGETHFFVGPRYIVSIRHGATPSSDAIRTRCESTPGLLATT